MCVGCVSGVIRVHRGILSAIHRVAVLQPAAGLEHSILSDSLVEIYAEMAVK